MRRTVTPILILFLGFTVALCVAEPRPAFAHGFGQTYDLPLPLWLYLYGAAAAVLVSFVPISLLGDKEDAPYGYPRFDLLRIEPLRALLTARALLFGLRLLSVALFLLVILSGFLGRQAPDFNFAPTFVWIIWWVGFSFFTAFVGNVWPLINPWKVLFEWADRLARRAGAKNGLELGEPYPAFLGVWPAVALYAAFIWVEIVFGGSAQPLNIALFVVLYSALTWGGMILFGKETWLRKGEAFSVFFGLLGRFAPTEVRVTRAELCERCGACGKGEGDCVNCYECFRRAAPEDRELNLRPPAAGLGRAEPVSPGGVFFVVLVLAGVAYDGLLETPMWLELIRFTPITQTSGLLVLPLIFLAVYLGFVKLSQLAGGGTGSLSLFASWYVYSLVPIAVAYQVAHYLTYLLIQGQAILRLVSDPFGWGWNLFGTAGYEVNVGVIGADTVWYSQVALIVGGHVIAVYLAHLVALRLLKDRRRALLSQVPMLALMILYTIFSLWLIGQPIAEEQRMSAAEEVSQPAPINESLREPPMPDPP